MLCITILYNILCNSQVNYILCVHAYTNALVYNQHTYTSSCGDRDMSMCAHNSVEYSLVFVDNQLIECTHCILYPSHLPVLHNVYQLSSINMHVHMSYIHAYFHKQIKAHTYVSSHSSYHKSTTTYAST